MINLYILENAVAEFPPIWPSNQMWAVVILTSTDGAFSAADYQARAEKYLRRENKSFDFLKPI